jgi:hypothetical protein
MKALDSVPEAICLIDQATLSIQSANSKFCRAIAPICRFKGLAFLENFVSKEDHARFRGGINRVLELKVVVFNVSALLLYWILCIRVYVNIFYKFSFEY